MKRFEYRLEPVQRLREQQRQQALRILGEAQRRTVETRERLAELGRERERARDDLASVRRGTVDMRLARLQEQYVRAIESWIDRTTDEVRQRMAEEAKARESYIEARKKVRVLERLRERRLERWKKEFQREEFKVLDEVAQRSGGIA